MQQFSRMDLENGHRGLEVFVKFFRYLATAPPVLSTPKDGFVPEHLTFPM